MPTESESVRRPFTTRCLNGVVRAYSSSKCSGWSFMVSAQKSTLSDSVIVRPRSWWIVSPTTNSSKYLPVKRAPTRLRAQILLAGPCLGIPMRPEMKDNLLLVGKSILLALGGLIAVAATVELVVGGPSARAFEYLLVGLALAVPPLAFAFRDAVRAGRRTESD